MRIVSLEGFGGPEVLRIAEAEKPRPGAGEVLIHVAAAGINRADIHQRQGNYPPPTGASEVLGLEVSGTIAERAPDADPRWKAGDAVCALVPGGGYAEYCVAHSCCCLPIPGELEKDPGTALTNAAALPESTMTVWANLFDPGSQCGRRLFAGVRFFMQGGTSGIGTIALQAAMAFGAHAAATAGSDEKCRFLRELGCEGAWNYRREDWAAAAWAWGDRVGGTPGVDVILDMVGGDYFPKHIELLARDGRLIHIAHGGGAEVKLDLRKLMLKRLMVTGSTLRSRPVEEKRRLRDGVEQHLWPLVNAGKIRPVVDRVYPIEDVAEAHRRMESSEHIGKIVLRISSPGAE
ncbi:MAG TPA: NAD(P)H-quinone oxidoreductase [Acidobacteriaceae bacterium]|jgi:NADPH2:quinone reductase